MDGRPQVASGANIVHSRAAGTPYRFDDEGIPDRARGGVAPAIRAKNHRLRMTDAGAFEAARQTRLVGSAVNGRRGRPEHDLPFLLDARGQPLEAAAALGRNRPHGIDRCDQLVEPRLACGRLQCNHLHAAWRRRRTPPIPRREDLVLSERRQIRDQRGQHRASLARKRRRQRLSGKTAAADELMDQNPHGDSRVK